MAIDVLIVDDSPVMRSFIGRVLDVSGLSVGRRLEASDGEEALALLARNRVDLVLTDVNMPRMDGEQFVRRLEQDRALRGIPVVVVSTDRSDARVGRMLALGARGYVKKPFLPETLRRELDKVLEAGLR